MQYHQQQPPQGQYLDDHFQSPRNGPVPHQTLDGVTNPYQAPPSKPSRIRSFLATDLNAQQTSPRPYFAGPNGRKGRMLLGAGFQPPANQYTGQTYRTMNDAKLNRAQRHQHLLQQREQRFQHYGARQVNAPPSTSSIMTVDRTAPQRYHFSPHERKQHLTSLLTKSEGNGGRRHGYGSPRSQNIGPGNWTYKDKTLARYRQYRPGHDQPNPTRPMARTEAQMLHRNNATYAQTPLYGAGGRREEANVYPPVQQNYGYGTHQYQDRMMLARTKMMLPNPANPATRSTSGSTIVPTIPRMPTTMDSIDMLASPRPQQQRTAANQRVPLLGVKEVSGRVEFMNRQKQVAPLQRAPVSYGPKLYSHGPKPASLVKRPAPAEYQRVERYGASLRHGRKDRVGFWQSPLTTREK